MRARMPQRFSTQNALHLTTLLLCLFIMSCEKVQEVSDQALNYFGLKGDQQKSTATKKAKKKKTKAAAPDNTAVTTPDKATSSSGTDNLIITHDEEEAKTDAKSTHLKTAEAPKFKVEAPVHVKRRIGGVARFIEADDKYIYMDFPQHLAIYNSQLELLAITQIAAPLLKIKKFVQDDRTFLFLKEENSIFEILELQTTSEEGKTIFTLMDMIKKEMEHDFSWIDANTAVVFSKTKIEVLDLADFEDIKISREISMSNVSDALALQDNLYLSRNQFLDIVGLKTGDLISSIRIGKDFAFLGMKQGDNKKNQLLLSFLDADHHLTGLQILTLTSDLSGIEDFGENIDFPKPLTRVSHDLSNNLILGQEAAQSAKPAAQLTDKPEDQPDDTDDTETTPAKAPDLQLFSLEHRRFLRGPITTDKHIQSWSLNRQKLYLVNNKGITINTVQIDNKIAGQSKTINYLINTSSQVPLAQIGASKIVKDEYNLKVLQNLDFMADSQKVVLLDENHFVSFEQTPPDNAHTLYATTLFGKDDFQLSRIENSGAVRFDKLLPTRFGILAYTGQTDQISFIDIDFTEVTTIPIMVNKLISWHHFTAPDGDEILMVASHNPHTAESKAPYRLAFYKLASPSEVQLVTSLLMAQPPFPYYVPENQIIVFSQDRMELYDWNRLSGKPQPKTEPQPETPGAGAVNETQVKDLIGDNKKVIEIEKEKEKTEDNSLNAIKPDEVVELTNQKHDIEAIKVSPALDKIYALIRENNRHKILIFDVFDTEKKTVLEDFEITAEQFEGASFSKEGRLFILPSEEGTLFYDVSILYRITEVAHWSLPSYHVDIYNQGQSICVALGYKGIYCGDLLF